MRIEYFGAKRQLLGSLHLAERLQPRATAVLLCNPFGEEASRSHRTFRVLATQLQRAGFSVMRFDYSCTGDSLGDSADASVAQWIDDIGAAADHLRHVSGASRIALCGLRLGATLAMRAGAIRGTRPRHVLMWDPIVDGRSYLRELAAQHRAYMRDELPQEPDRLRVRPDGTPEQALGAPISAALAAELDAIDLATVPPVADQHTVIVTKTGPAAERLRAHLPASTRWLEMTETTAWNSDAALNAMVVPIEIVQALIAQLEKSP